MRPHAVLSRRGALGLAGLLAFARPAAASGRVVGTAIHGEVLQIRGFGQGVCIDRAGLGEIPGDLVVDVRTGEVLDAPTPGRVDASSPAPWGWDTLENVR